MKKIIKQDGKRKVFIYDDGSERSFEEVKNSVDKEIIKEKKYFKKTKEIED